MSIIPESSWEKLINNKAMFVGFAKILATENEVIYICQFVKLLYN